jgi:hypothetical protein
MTSSKSRLDEGMGRDELLSRVRALASHHTPALLATDQEAIWRRALRQAADELESYYNATFILSETATVEEPSVYDQHNYQMQDSRNDKQSEALTELAEVEEAIWNATGSALLAGEKAPVGDAQKIYQSLCEAGNRVAYARSLLSSHGGERLTPDWCMDAFWRANPGRNAVVPSLYLLDFAREVLRAFAPSATASIRQQAFIEAADFLEDHYWDSFEDNAAHRAHVRAVSQKLREIAATESRSKE